MTRNAKVQIAGRLSYREQLEAFWAERPEASQSQARKATGAPQKVVRHVQRRLIAEGRLAAKPHAWDAFTAVA